MGALIIGAEERLAIAKLKLMAEANPMEVVKMVEAHQRDPDAYVEMLDGFNIVLPIDHSVCYTHEIQPDGLRHHHVSIMVLPAGYVCGIAAAQMILHLFGMGRIPEDMIAMWIDETATPSPTLNLCQVISGALN